MLRAELKVIGGKQHGSTIPLATKKFLVGREQDCQLRPTSESVSRHHCVFSLDEFGVRLRDLGSTNGTFVNNTRVQGSVLLHPGDRVLIGKLEFEVLVLDTVQATKHAKTAVSMSLSDSSGFMLSDLAESPESALERATMLDSVPTEILGSDDHMTNETGVMSADRTAVAPAKVVQPDPFMQTMVAEEFLPVEVPLTDENIPVVPNTPPTLTPPPAPPMPTQQMPAQLMPQMAPGMQMGGMPIQQQPYGMPGYGQQPAYIQAPFSGYAPQYMPSPYGMPQQGYMDPYQQQQMAYQQQMAMQQQMAAQQAMMASQYTAPAMPETEPEPEEETSAKIAPPQVTLPPPEETGAKPVAPPPPPAPTAEGAAPAAPVVKPNQLAADILKKYMNR